jgi:hypothetical protein
MAAAEARNLRDPFRLAELADDVAALAALAEGRGALVRGDVVRHLFLAGWMKLHPALHAQPNGKQALLTTWQLMLESVVTGSFGVSSDDWREHQAYPDRYFPRLWLDVLPEAASRLSPAAFAMLASRCFNLGENVAPRSRTLANELGELLYKARKTLTEDTLAVVVERALIDAGLHEPPDDSTEPKRRLVVAPTLELERQHPTFSVGDVAVDGEGTYLIDAHSDSTLRLVVEGLGLSLGALDPFAYFERAPALERDTAFGRVAWKQDALFLDGRKLVACPLAWPVSLHSDESWLVIADGLSRRVQVYRWHG